MKKFNFGGLLKNRKFVVTVSFIGLFLISVGLSLLVFYFVNPKGASGILSKIDQKTKLNVNLPKTEACPINGAMYTKVESDTWSARRPISMMIENHVDARPESGLSRADVVYEAVAEGGITRFNAIFYCAAAAEDVLAAPLRSARVYFINLAAGYGTDPIFLHQGEANNICSDCPGGVKPSSQINPQVNALTLFDKLGWQGGTGGNNLDGGYNIGFPIVERNQYRLSSTPAAWEHSVVADLNLVWAEATKRGFNYNDSTGTPWTKGFTKWLFQDGKATSSPVASDIKFDFWTSMPGYDVEWKYDSTTNSYMRYNAGQPFIDWEFDKPQIAVKNVVVMFAKETGPLDSEHHMYYQDIGTGNALVFQNGQVITGTWKKATPLDRDVYYDTTGKEISMVRGQTWVEVLPAGNKVSY